MNPIPSVFSLPSPLQQQQQQRSPSPHLHIIDNQTSNNNDDASLEYIPVIHPTTRRITIQRPDGAAASAVVGGNLDARGLRYVLGSGDVLSSSSSYHDRRLRVSALRKHLATGEMPRVPSDDAISSDDDRNFGEADDDEDENDDEQKNVGGATTTTKQKKHAVVDEEYLTEDLRQRPPASTTLTRLEDVLYQHHALPTQPSSIDWLPQLLAVGSLVFMTPILLINNGYTLTIAFLYVAALFSVYKSVGPLTVYRNFGNRVRALPRIPFYCFLATYFVVIVSHALLLPFHLHHHDESRASSPKRLYDCLVRKTTEITDDPQTILYCKITAPGSISVVLHFAVSLFFSIAYGLFVRSGLATTRTRQYHNILRAHCPKVAHRAIHSIEYTSQATLSRRNIVRCAVVSVLATAAAPAWWQYHDFTTLLAHVSAFAAQACLVLFSVLFLLFAVQCSKNFLSVQQHMVPSEQRFAELNFSTTLLSSSPTKTTSYTSSSSSSSPLSPVGFVLEWWRLRALVDQTMRPQKLVLETSTALIFIVDAILLFLFAFYVFVSDEGFATLLRQLVGILALIFSFFLVVYIHYEQNSCFMRHMQLRLMYDTLLMSAALCGDDGGSSDIHRLVDGWIEHPDAFDPHIGGVHLTPSTAKKINFLVLFGVICVFSR
eukprot:PhM_4_TR11284/c0_g1_i1/m.21979